MFQSRLASVHLGLLAAAGAVTLAAGWWLAARPRPAAVMPLAAAPPALQSYSPLDPQNAAEINRLRRDLKLDDDALSSLNLSDAQLEAHLDSLRDWYETNVASLQSSWKTIADTNALIRHHESEIANGIDAAAALKNAKQALAAAENAYAAQLSGLEAALTQSWSGSQNTLFATLKSQSSLDMPYRVLSLTAEQQNALAVAQVKYAQRRAVAYTPELQQQALDDFQQEQNAAIGAANQQTLGQLTYLKDASVRVVNAVKLVLPVKGG